MPSPLSCEHRACWAGGRWDGLLKAAWPVSAPSAGAPLGAAGVTLNVERLLDCLPAPRSPAMRASQVRSLRTLEDGCEASLEVVLLTNDIQAGSCSSTLSTRRAVRAAAPLEAD